MRSLQSELRKVVQFQHRERARERNAAQREDKPIEQMTDRDWSELMGQNRDTFRRVGGRVRKR